jgi:hypothetical protein
MALPDSAHGAGAGAGAGMRAEAIECTHAVLDDSAQEVGTAESGRSGRVVEAATL